MKMMRFFYSELPYVIMLLLWLIIPKLDLNEFDQFKWFCISWILSTVIGNVWEKFLNQQDEKIRSKKINKKVIPLNSHLNLKTRLEFNYKENIWKLIDYWAKQNSYKCISVNNNGYTYQRKFFLYGNGRSKLKVTCVNFNVVIETWYEHNSLITMSYDKLGIESGDSRMIVMRKKCRCLINTLLKLLNQEPIL